MKIQRVTPEHRAKVYALLRGAFPGQPGPATLVQRLHDGGRPLHEWVCLQTNKAIAYIAFSSAYHGPEVCGLHLATLAVAPEMRKQGIGSELLRFALRQEAICLTPLFVLGAPGFFRRFGFAPCDNPVSRFSTPKSPLLALHNSAESSFVLGYDPEFGQKVAAPPGSTAKKKRR